MAPNPSPRAHIYRLVIILILGTAGFLGIKTLAVPDTWDDEKWYRRGAEEDLKAQPMRIGGNESCLASACHDDARPNTHDARYKTVSQGRHQGLACENCHGPLSAHVKDGETVGHARLDPNTELCLGCHQRLVSRPKDFTQFSVELLYHEILKVTDISPCRACHDPHEPK